MEPPFFIMSVRDLGPLDDGADATLYAVELHEGNGLPDTLHFSVARSQGRPSAEEMRAWIELRASQFANDRSVVSQFRALETWHGRDCRVILLRRPRGGERSTGSPAPTP